VSALLSVTELSSGYGRTPVLFGVDLAIAPGESFALVGRNGMGKSTTIRTVMGLCRATGGSVRIDGVDVTRWPSHRIARCGVGWVPEGRQVFPALTVRENLVATAAAYGGSSCAWSLEDVYALFPRLRERQRNLGSALSGGEAQMVAIGRALMLGPRLLILDEATEGLAPVIRDEIWSTIARLRERGIAILIVDKNLDALTAVADRAAVIEKGRTVWTGPMHALARDETLHDRYLTV
jgi:branched-chain amino acid transport system ATP-binding protein